MGRLLLGILDAGGELLITTGTPQRLILLAHRGPQIRGALRFAANHRHILVGTLIRHSRLIVIRKQRGLITPVPLLDCVRHQ